MWDAVVHQKGSRVAAPAADYTRAVAAHGTLSFGFVGARRGRNRPAVRRHAKRHVRVAG